MKNFYVLLTCFIFAIVVIFSGHFAQCQYYYSVDSSMEMAPLTPELYIDDQNQGEVITHFGGVTAVGNILYIPVTKTMMPPAFTTPSSDSSSQSPDSQNMLRAIDFSNPMEPMLIGDMDMGPDLDLWGGPQYYMIISGEYVYVLKNEVDANFDTSEHFSITSEEVNFSIYKIQDNKNLVITKSMPLIDIFNSVKVDESETFFPQLLKVTDNRAYIIFYGASYPEPPANEYPSEADAYLPLSQPENNTVENNDTGIEAYAPSQTDVTSYSSSPPDNSAVIVTIDIANPHDAKVIGVARLQLACVPANVDLLVSDNIAYLLVSSMASSDSIIYESKIYVLDISSPTDILEINSLTAYGNGGQLVKEGDNLYTASKGFGLQIFDISTPTAPEFVSLLETPYPLTDSYYGGLQLENNIIIVKDGYVYLRDKENGLLVIDVSDSSNPAIVSSYLSEYIFSNSSWYSYYASGFVAICGDYLLLSEVGKVDDGNSINIVSIADPLNPVSIGIIGERSPEMLTLVLKLDVAELFNIHTEQSAEGDIALFGIPSLDALNRKYGVYKIEYPNTRNLSYYVPYGASAPPLSTEDYDYPVEDIKKDRGLRTFYLTFPGSAGLDEIVSDYQENPYVITAEISMPVIYGGPGPYGYPYYPIQEPGPGIYGGIYGSSLYGGMYGMYGSSYGGIYGGSLYGGIYGGGLYGGIYGAPYSGQLYGGGLYGGMYGMYGSSYGGVYGGIYGSSLYGSGLYGSYSSIPQPSGYPSYYGVGGLGITSGLATSYPVLAGLGIPPGLAPSYPISTISSGTYPSAITYPYGGYGGYGSYMHTAVSPAGIPEPTIRIGAINIEGGVHIGTLTINSEPSSTIPRLSIMFISDMEPLRESVTYPPQGTTSSNNEALPENTGSTNDSGKNQLNTGVNNTTSWIGTQNKASSSLWDNWPLSSSTPNSWIW
ncbi:MAG: LVIVD repeat-containing protein [bacterium]